MDQMDQPDQTDQPAGDLASYTGTELDPALDVDFDLDDFEDEQNDTMRIVSFCSSSKSSRSKSTSSAGSSSVPV
jgi:hypothetical protein